MNNDQKRSQDIKKFSAAKMYKAGNNGLNVKLLETFNTFSSCITKNNFFLRYLIIRNSFQSIIFLQLSYSLQLISKSHHGINDLALIYGKQAKIFFFKSLMKRLISRSSHLFHSLNDTDCHLVNLSWLACRSQHAC